MRQPNMASGAMALLTGLCLITGSEALGFPMASFSPPAPVPPPGQSPVPGVNIVPTNLAPVTGLSSSIVAPGQPPSLPASLGSGLSLSTSKDVKFFKNLTDGFSEIAFNYIENSTATVSSELSCKKHCLGDDDCVLVLWCEKEEEATPSSGSSGPIGAPVNLNQNFECKVFQKSTSETQVLPETEAKWTSKCTYMQIHPDCKAGSTQEGWVKSGKPTISADHTLSQNYVCGANYVIEGKINNIKCDKTGVDTVTGGCTQSPVNPVSGIPAPSVGGGLTGSAGSGSSVLSNLIAPNALSGSGMAGFSTRESCSNTPPPCGDNAECHDTDSSYTCTCNTGYEMHDGNCVDFDECAELNPCQMDEVCTNTDGLYECADKDECTDGSHGCGINSYCVNNNPGYECFCNTGYAKENGEGDCIDVDECQNGNFTCDVNSICVNSVGSHTCKQCGSGFKVEAEKNECVDIDECNQGGCGENSDCVNTAGSFECTCLEGYNMDNDQCVDIDECQLEKCDVSATCVNNAGSFECTCLEGYKMENDQCVDKDECTDGSHNCSLNSDCVNNSPGFQCDCHSGYEKDGDDCVDIDECQLDKCDVSATCVNNAGSFECTCLEGYKMENDQCVDKDECTDGSHNCSLNSDCVNNSPGFQCDCHSGYENDGDDCVDIDECQLDKCDVSATCVNNAGSFECTCLEGYKMENDQCVDFDECAELNPCQMDEVCTNTDGDYECADKDECSDESHNCGSNSYCVNNSPGFQCDCHSGYQKDGDDCIDFDECAELNPCQTDEVCTNTDGDYECAAQSPSEVCQARGYTYDETSNFCFKVVKDSVVKTDADEACTNEGGGARLAMPNTLDKISAIRNYIKGSSAIYDEYLWVGATQLYDDWRLYYEWTYTYWTYDWWAYWYYGYYYGYYLYYTYTEYAETVAWSDTSLVARNLFSYTPYFTWDECTDMDHFFYYYLYEISCDKKMSYVCEIPVKNCPEPFKYDEQSHFCYHYEDEVVDKKETAEEECENANPNARLAVTNTQRKIDVIKDYKDNMVFCINCDNPVIVGADQDDEFSYYYGTEINTWSDGSDIRLNLFTDYWYLYYFYPCVYIYKDKLLDTSCSGQTFTYVCEIPQ